MLAARALALLALSVFSRADVIELDEDIFDEVLASSPTFVKFFSPSCPHCQKIAPIWDKMADQLDANPSPPFQVGDVDCSNNGPLCDRFGIRGVPALLFFKDGKMYKYQGPREYKDIMKFGGGDYRDSKEVADIPPAGGVGAGVISNTTYKLLKLVKDVHAMIQFNPWAVIVILVFGFFAGTGVTFLVALIALRPPPVGSPSAVEKGMSPSVESVVPAGNDNGSSKSESAKKVD